MNDSHEGTEPIPIGAERVFGGRLPMAVTYARHLCTTGTDWGLIGPRELPRLWTRHILNCAAVGEVIPSGTSVIDVGSGAGLPGIPLALADPSLTVTLVEPLERRCAWLQMVIDDLGTMQTQPFNVQVRRGRAEEVDLHADIVCSRAVAPLPKLLRWCAPLTSPGGTIVAMKGSSAELEVDRVAPRLPSMGLADPRILSCGAAYLDPPTRVVTVKRKAPTATGSVARTRVKPARGR